MKFFSPNPKKLLTVNLQNLKIINLLYFFPKVSVKKKVSYTFPYKEETVSKPKYFLIIIIKRFFSFYFFF